MYKCYYLFEYEDSYARGYLFKSEDDMKSHITEEDYDPDVVCVFDDKKNLDEVVNYLKGDLCYFDRIALLITPLEMPGMVLTICADL